MTKITCIADIQNQCQKIKPSQIPDSDLLIVGGDLTNYGDLRDLVIFNEWLGKLPNKRKVVVFGNHELRTKNIDAHALFTNATFLHDELIEIEGLKIFGSPVNECGPYKDYWAYCETSYIKRICPLIPECDILVTHGCPWGILDSTPSEAHIGSKEILKAVKRVKPKLHVFGHAHLNHGIIDRGGTRFINGALCDEQNNIVKADGSLMRKPIVVEI